MADPKAIIRPWCPRVYTPGEIVRHDSRLWLCAYHRAVTSTNPPGSAEDTIWSVIKDGVWRHSTVPEIVRPGWRKKMTERLLSMADADSAAYRTLQYVSGPQGQTPYMPPGMRDHWQPNEVSALRQRLGLSVRDLHDMQQKRRRRRLRRMGCAQWRL